MVYLPAIETVGITIPSTTVARAKASCICSSETRGQAPVTGREYFNLTRSGRGTSTEVAQKQCPCPCTDLVMRV